MRLGLVEIAMILAIPIAIITFLIADSASPSPRPIEMPYTLTVQDTGGRFLIYGKADTSKCAGPLQVRAIQFMNGDKISTLCMNEQYSSQEVVNLGPWQTEPLGTKVRLAYFDDTLSIMFTDWTNL